MKKFLIYRIHKTWKGSLNLYIPHIWVYFKLSDICKSFTPISIIIATIIIILRGRESKRKKQNSHSLFFPPQMPTMSGVGAGKKPGTGTSIQTHMLVAGEFIYLSYHCCPLRSALPGSWNWKLEQGLRLRHADTGYRHHNKHLNH